MGYVLAAVGLGSVVTLASAQVLSGTLSVDAATSSISAAGSIDTFQVVQQAPGSLTTSYDGNLEVQIDLGTNQLTIVSGSVVARNSGNWSPLADATAGTAPANYGGRVDGGFLGSVAIAARNVALMPAPGTVPLTVAGTTYSFAANQTVTAQTGSVATLGTGFIALVTGVSSLVGQSAPNTAGQAEITLVGGNVYRLTYPVSASFVFFVGPGLPAMLTLTGTIQAEGTLIGADSQQPTLIAVVSRKRHG